MAPVVLLKKTFIIRKYRYLPVLFLQRFMKIEIGFKITFCFDRENLTDLPRKRRLVRIYKNLHIIILCIIWMTSYGLQKRVGLHKSGLKDTSSHNVPI